MASPFSQLANPVTGRVNAASALIVGRVAYIDTVRVWFRRRLGKSHLRRLKTLCDGDAWFEFEPMEYQPQWVCLAVLHQPRDAAFAYLDGLGTRYLINGLHLALDHITRTKAGANGLQRFFDEHLVKRWRGKQRLGNFGDTHYQAHPTGRVANQICVYSDRPSKRSGSVKPKPCCHLEWRSQGALAVRAARVTSFKDLMNFDHRAFWKKRLLLEAVDLLKLGRAIQGTSRRGRWDKIVKLRHGRVLKIDRDMRAGHIAARLAAYRDADEFGNSIRPYGSAQAIRDECRGWIAPSRLRASFTRLPNNRFLPV